MFLFILVSVYLLVINNKKDYGGVIAENNDNLLWLKDSPSVSNIRVM